MAARADAIAPTPGFSDKQYERLALLYICASVRRGSWLIPAFHAAVDAGIKDAHDDPQNFELKKFADKLKSILKKIDLFFLGDEDHAERTMVGAQFLLACCKRTSRCVFIGAADVAEEAHQA